VYQAGIGARYISNTSTSSILKYLDSRDLPSTIEGTLGVNKRKRRDRDFGCILKRKK